MPQFAASVWSATQAAPQSVRPAGHPGATAHAPPEHVCPEGQAIVAKVIPSALHTRRSVEEVQVAAPGIQPGRRHSPAVQVSPAAQAVTV